MELNGQEYWPAGSYPHGPAMGGGGPMHAAHGPDGTQTYVPGGVPGMTAGGEPPRWAGSEVPAVVQDYEPGTGRPGGSLGGGTVGGPYRDRSDEQHQTSPDDADDADWPEHRGIPPRPGVDWPAPYMDGYWPQGGIGTAQSPGMSVGASERGRPPGPTGKSAQDQDGEEARERAGIDGTAGDAQDAPHRFLPDKDGDPQSCLICGLSHAGSHAGKGAGITGEPVSADVVRRRMEGNFPDSAIGWVRRASWRLCEVPWDLIDDDDISSWAPRTSRRPLTGTPARSGPGRMRSRGC